MVVDQSTQDYLDDLGLEDYIERCTKDLIMLCDLVIDDKDKKLLERIKAVESKRDKAIRILKDIKKEIDPGSMICSANPGYH